MFEIDTQQLRDVIVEQLRRWVAQMPDPDQPFFQVAGDDEEDDQATTPRQIYEQVASGTAQGKAIVERWIQMAVANVMEADLGKEEEAEPRESGAAVPGGHWQSHGFASEAEAGDILEIEDAGGLAEAARAEDQEFEPRRSDSGYLEAT